MVPHVVYDQLLEVGASRGSGFIVLIDPDKLPASELPAFVESLAAAGVDALFIGGSLMHATELDAYLRLLKAHTDLPVIGFPGALTQITPALDAVLYLSVVSSRNPTYLIGQHVQAAPLIRRMGLEPISTGYMLVESGPLTTAQYMTGSMPLPRRKPDVAAATALAAEMMGMRLLFTDGGSGAAETVPQDIVRAICATCSVPLIVGGGLTRPEEIEARVEAGASFVVVGNAIERRPDPVYVAELAAAAHVGAPRPTEVE